MYKKLIYYFLIVIAITTALMIGLLLGVQEKLFGSSGKNDQAGNGSQLWSRDVKNWKQASFGPNNYAGFESEITFLYPPEWDIGESSDPEVGRIIAVGPSLEKNKEVIYFEIIEALPLICTLSEAECIQEGSGAPTKLINAKEFYDRQVNELKNGALFLGYTTIDGMTAALAKHGKNGIGAFLPIDERVIGVVDLIGDEKLFNDFLATVRID